LVGLPAKILPLPESALQQIKLTAELQLMDQQSLAGDLHVLIFISVVL
jgi:hypothetical protein